MEELWNRLFGRGFNVLVKIETLCLYLVCSGLETFTFTYLFLSLSFLLSKIDKR